MRRRLVVVLLAVPLLTACGSKTIDSRLLEKDVDAWVHQQATTHKNEKVDVNCPDGVKAEPGRTFHCVVTDKQGESLRVTVTVENSDGDVTWVAG